MAFDPSTARPVVDQPKQGLNPATARPIDDAQPEPQPEQRSFYDTLRQSLAVPAQLGKGAFDAVAGTIDIIPQGVNAAARLSGVDAQLPTVQGSFGQYFQNTMEPGIGRDIVNAAGNTIPAAMGMVPVARAPSTASLVSDFVGFGSSQPIGIPGMLPQMAVTRAPQILDGAAPGKTKEEIAAALLRGEPNANTAGYILEAPDVAVGGMPKLVKDAPAKAVLKTGDEPSIVALIDKSDPLTRRNMERMVNVTDNLMIDKSVKGRALDVVGNSIINRYRVLDTANKIAGKMVNAEAKKLTGQVDLGYTINNFQRGLAERGVEVTPEGLDYSASIFSKLPTTQKVLDNIYSDLLANPNMDAKKAHFFKRAVTKSAQFGANVEGVDSDAVSLIRGVRAGVNEALGKTNTAYANANKHYSDTVGQLEQLTDAAGVKVDFDGPNSGRAAGTVASRILTNYGSGPNVDTALTNLTDLSRKYLSGVEGFDSKLLQKATKITPEDLADDLFNQAQFAIYLEQKIGTNATRSMTGIQQGAQAKAAEDLITGGFGPSNLLRTGIRAYRDATGKGYRDQLQSMRELLQERGSIK